MKVRFIVPIALLIFHVPAFSQNGAVAVDYLRSIGKIYAVVAVVLLLFLGLVLYLIALDRKVTKLEKHFNNDQ